MAQAKHRRPTSESDVGRLGGFAQTSNGVNKKEKNKFLPSYKETKPKSLWGRIVSIVAASLGLALVIILILGGALLSGRAFDPAWNPLRPNPSKVINNAFLNIPKIKTLHSELKIYKLSGVDINLDGNFDFTKINNIRGSGRLGVLWDHNFINGDFNITGNDMYFNVSDASQPFFNSTFSKDLNTVRGKWIKLPLSYSVAVLDVAKIIFPTVIESANKTYVFENKLPDKTVDGQNLYQYSIKLDSIMSISSQEKLKNTENNLFAEFIEKYIYDFLGESNSAEISISSKDNYIYGFNIQNKVQVNNSKINQQLNIDEPLKYKNFEDIFPNFSL